MRQATAPAARARGTDALSPVMTTIGIAAIAASLRAADSTSNPFRPGILRSRKTSDGAGARRSEARASSPSAAVSGSKPSLERTRATMSRKSSSSSTMSTVMDLSALGELDQERRAPPRLALDPDGSAEPLDDRARDVEAEAEAAVVARRRRALEGTEDRVASLGRDADAVVHDLEPRLRVVALERDLDGPAEAELDRVREEVRDHLSEA